MPHAACPRPGSRPELSRSQKTTAANICSFVIQDCCAVDIHWGPEQRQWQQLKLQVVVAHCAIKAKAAGSEEKTAAAAAAIEENPSLISPKVAAGSKNKGQNGQPEGERERETQSRRSTHCECATCCCCSCCCCCCCRLQTSDATGWQAKSQTALGHLRQRN